MAVFVWIPWNGRQEGVQIEAHCLLHINLTIFYDYSTHLNTNITVVGIVLVTALIIALLEDLHSGYVLLSSQPVSIGSHGCLRQFPNWHIVFQVSFEGVCKSLTQS